MRDLYLKRTPKDFDIATDARPNKLRKIFRNCRVIGRRFRLVHVFFPPDITVEVSTFRKGAESAQKQENGLILADNTFGSPEEDARRRDLTINGLFYDIGTFSILDYVAGVEDLRRRVIRTITPPEQSFQEDPVRMIRALRHAARLDFSIDPDTYEAMLANRSLIAQVNASRMSEEIFRDLRAGASERFFRLMHETGLLVHLLPELAAEIDADPLHVVWSRLQALDRAIDEGRDPSTAVLLTVLWHTLIVPPQIDRRSKDARRQDVGRAIHHNIKRLHATFRASLHVSNRIMQIVLAMRRIRSIPPGADLPRAMLGKAYLPDALQCLEIIEAAAERPVAHLQALMDQAQEALDERREEREIRRETQDEGEVPAPPARNAAARGKSPPGSRRRRRRPRRDPMP